MTGIADDRWRRASPWIWGLAACALLMPLVAMAFTGELAWGPGDFLVFGGMLIAACGGYELAVRATGSNVRRVTIGVAIVVLFLMVWAELAVGIFD